MGSPARVYQLFVRKDSRTTPKATNTIPYSLRDSPFLSFFWLLPISIDPFLILFSNSSQKTIQFFIIANSLRTLSLMETKSFIFLLISPPTTTYAGTRRKESRILINFNHLISLG